MKLENLGVVSQSYKYIPSRLILIILIVGLASNNFLGIEPPVNVNLLKNGDNVIISWDEVNGSEKYYIYKGYSSYEELTKTDSTTILSYQETETQSKCFYNITSSDKFTVNMTFVEGSEYLMGDHYHDGYYDEWPLHMVEVNNFYIQDTEVTQKEWVEIMGVDNIVSSNWGCWGVGDNFPAYGLSWYDAIVYCNKRSIRDGLFPCYSINGSSNPDDWGEIPTVSNPDWNNVQCNWNSNGYRLLTEAEWEYAARGGLFHNENLRFSGFNDPEKAEKYCWVNENSPSVKEVASLLPNQLDIYDMSGNVWEWCWDWYEYYSSDSQIDPTGPLGNSWKVQRGGGFRNFETSIRVSARDFLSQCFYINYTGLSLARSIENNRISEYGNFNFQLYQNYPNPFNPVTSISYALPQASQVELNVYNLQGQLVQSLVNGKMGKGVHKAEFNGADLTSGMYIYNLKVDGETVQSKKMMLLK